MNRPDGIKVFINEEILGKAPKCPHGPTLMFERITCKGTKQFYACSANRDRKLCNFYQLLSENGTSVKQKSVFEPQCDPSDETFERMWKQFRKMPASKRKFCKTCGEPSEGSETNHEGHIILEGVKDELLHRPTILLEPLIHNKGAAQYHFNNKTKDALTQIVHSLAVSHVLCIGTPSLFEEMRCTDKVECFLMDIDLRLIRLSPKSSAAQYNMFNHWFFNNAGGVSSYFKFLSSARRVDATGSKIMVIIDPPFGGMAELILYNLSMISKDFFSSNYAAQILPSLIAFPYFVEHKLCVDSFTMVDLEVSYENHSKLRKRKNQVNDDIDELSVVKFFTNINQSKIVLPSELGYRFCKPCQRYISSANKHCSKCGFCTTRVGKTYHHCDICEKCVKASWHHCNECNVCELPGRHSKKRKIRED